MSTPSRFQEGMTRKTGRFTRFRLFALLVALLTLIASSTGRTQPFRGPEGGPGGPGGGRGGGFDPNTVFDMMSGGKDTSRRRSARPCKAIFRNVHLSSVCGLVKPMVCKTPPC